MEYILSLHAKERIERRKISMDVLDDVIRQPDDKIEETACNMGISKNERK